MEIITNEYYVSLEVAKLLKKAGFDFECRKIYYCYREDDDTWELEDNYKIHQHILELNYCLLAPTLSVAQKWLREVKNIDVFVLFGHFEPKINGYTYEIRHKGTRIILSEWVNTTYEGALEVGINKALELILEKRE